MIRARRAYSPHELVADLDQTFGVVARWDLVEVLRSLANGNRLTRAGREYIQSLLDSDDLPQALRGEKGPSRAISSTIDELLRESRIYRDSKAFREMIEFTARFRDYAPYNLMLVRLQNPSCFPWPPTPGPC